jgi:hypothetical protein
VTVAIAGRMRRGLARYHRASGRFDGIASHERRQGWGFVDRLGSSALEMSQRCPEFGAMTSLPRPGLGKAGRSVKGAGGLARGTGHDGRGFS